MASTASLSYEEHYARLQATAKKLQGAQTVNVDELLADVKNAIESYQVCKDRIDAAVGELKQLLAPLADAAGVEPRGRGAGDAIG